MKPVSMILIWGAQLVFERPVRKLTMDELIAQLELSAKQMTERLENCVDTPNNRRQLSHVVGIERWGQRRLRVAFREPFLAEEYDHYRPSLECSWHDLLDEWKTTRQITLTLAREFAQNITDQELKIFHNMYGPLSIKGWLRYLDIHASSEGKRIK